MENLVDEIYEKAIDAMRKYSVCYKADKKLTWDKTKVAFHLTCPYCGVHVRNSEYVVFEGPGAFNFCPNCGEDLREDKD